MTAYHLDVEFAGPDGRVHLDQFTLQAADVEAAKAEAGPLVAIIPACFYDRTARLYANETLLVAVWSEKAVAS